MDDTPASVTPRSSSNLAELFTALSLAQGELSDPPKNRTAEVGKYNYKYSDLSDLLKIIRPVFSKHGMYLLQFATNARRGAVTVVTRICHSSGQWIESDLTIAVADDRPQTLGSAITYARRYSAAAAAGLSPEDDDDGKAAQEAPDKTTPPEKKSAWQSKREDGPAAKAGAAAAVAAAAPGIIKDLEKIREPKPRLYNPRNKPDVNWLYDKLDALNVPHDKRDVISAQMDGRPGSDLGSIVDRVING